MIAQPAACSALRSVAGVGAVCHQTWFGGIYQEPKNFFATMPVEPEDAGDGAVVSFKSCAEALYAAKRTGKNRTCRG